MFRLLGVLRPNKWYKVGTLSLAATVLGLSQNEDKEEEHEAHNSLDTTKYEVVQVQVLHRHGDRSPINWYPAEYHGRWKCDTKLAHAAPVSKAGELEENSNDQSVHLYPCYPGQLTPLGKQQMNALGAKLRGRYVEYAHFLNR
jgi:hypothetical protein